MRRRGCGLLLVVCFAAASAADAAAGPALPKGCRSSFGPGVLAMICDPGGGSGAGFSIDADGGTATGKPGTGIARLRGSEPFQDGERIGFDLRGGTRSTVVALDAVATRDGRRSVVIEPFDPAARRYEVEIDGGVARVTTDDGRVRRIRFVRTEPPRVPSGTSRAAIRSFVRLITGDDVASLQAACNLLSSDSRTLLSADGDCPSLLGFVLFDEEVDTYPELRSIAVRRVRIDRRHPMIARVELVYGFAPRPLRVWATVALANEPGGWRIAFPERFSPRYAVRGDAELTVSQVRRRLSALHRAARKVRARARNHRQATRSLIAAPTACPEPIRSAVDAQRDVTMTDGDHARRQDDAGVDLIGASQSFSGGRVCFELRFRTPLPAVAGFDLWLLQRAPVRGRPLVGDAVRVELSGDGAVATHELVGHRYFPVEVRISPTREAVSVALSAGRGWGIIDTSLSYRWAVEAWRPLPAINNAYLDDLEP